MNYSEIITEIYNQVQSENINGQVAEYIPELAKVNTDFFGVYIATVRGEHFGIGDFREPFSIQSISKVFTLCYAYKLLGEDLWERVGVEPSGTPFNSLVQLESDKGKPRNPFINAGAMVVCDILISLLKNPLEDFLTFVREITKIPDINYCESIAKSEKSVGFTNIALCNYIKSFGNIKNNPEDVLEFYFKICSIKLSCEDLSKSFMFLTCENKHKSESKCSLTLSQSKRVKAIMQTCGFYDESGEFAFRVGLPGKSGVGGGIIAICPGKYSIVTWSPMLNEKGNSKKGMRFLEEFTTKTQISIF